MIGLPLVSHSTAAKDSRISIVGSGTRSEFRTDNDFPFEFGGERGHGAGLLLDVDFGAPVHLEVGGIYGRTILVDRQGGPAGIPDEFWGLQVPVLARLWLGSVFSLAAGPYYTFSFTDEARDDYGATLSAAFVVPFSKDFGLRLDGRYNAGFKDLTGDEPGHLASSSLQLLAGLEFRL